MQCEQTAVVIRTGMWEGLRQELDGWGRGTTWTRPSKPTNQPPCATQTQQQISHSKLNVHLQRCCSEWYTNLQNASTKFLPALLSLYMGLRPVC